MPETTEQRADHTADQQDVDAVRRNIDDLRGQASGIDLESASPEERGRFRRLVGSLGELIEAMTPEQSKSYEQLLESMQDFESVFRTDDELYLANEVLALALGGNRERLEEVLVRLSSIQRLAKVRITEEQAVRLQALRDALQPITSRISNPIARAPSYTSPDDKGWLPGVH